MKCKVTVVLMPAEEGGWVAYAPVLGWATEGDTKEHALAMAKEMIELMLEEPKPDDLDALDIAYSPNAALAEVEVHVPSQEETRATG